jgi:hypothetical protein
MRFAYSTLLGRSMFQLTPQTHAVSVAFAKEVAKLSLVISSFGPCKHHAVMCPTSPVEIHTVNDNIYFNTPPFALIVVMQ